jgi:hypothetical protein
MSEGIKFYTDEPKGKPLVSITREGEKINSINVDIEAINSVVEQLTAANALVDRLEAEWETLKDNYSAEGMTDKQYRQYTLQTTLAALAEIQQFK